MNIIYDNKTDTLRIEFLDTPSTKPREHDGILTHHTSDGALASIEIPNISRTVPLEAFKKTYLDLPTCSGEGIIE